MVRAMFSATSSMRNHQVRMDAIGNNIANVNTTGFKASRVNFATALSQTLRAATAPVQTRGGSNPFQIGLGMMASSTDTVFSQGNLQMTGKGSDIAIEGDGFLLLSDGSRLAYTRDGTLGLDAEGSLTALASGLRVQGWRAVDGVVDLGGTLGALGIPVGAMAIARATRSVTYGGNLSAEQTGYSSATGRALAGNRVEAVVSVQVGTNVVNVTVPGTAAGATPASPGAGSGAYSPAPLAVSPELALSGQVGAEAAFQVTCAGRAVDGTPLEMTGTWTNASGADITSIDDFANAWNNPANWSGGQVAVKVLKESANTIRFFGVLRGNNASFTITETPRAAGEAGHLGLMSGVGVVNGQSAEANGEYNGLQLAWALTWNQYQGGAATGVGATTDGAGGLTVTSGTGGTAGNLVLSDVSGRDVLDYFGAAPVAGALPTARTSMLVYDSLGLTHSLNLEFNRVGNQNSWEWRASDADSGQLLQSGFIGFDANGTCVSPSASVTLTLNNGAVSPQTIALNFANVQQLAGGTTASPVAQDGVPSGVLESYAIGGDGTITGIFSNGLNQALGQIALANFTNPSGLICEADNLWLESINSGLPQVGVAGQGQRGALLAGALEMSNVDLANEFTNMIVAQRGFQANSRVVTVSDEMLQELLNLRR